MHYLIIQRERLLIFSSTVGNLNERINTALVWKPEIIKPHEYDYRYHLPDWIKNLDKMRDIRKELNQLDEEIRQARQSINLDRLDQLNNVHHAKVNELHVLEQKPDRPTFRHANVQDFWFKLVEGKIPESTERNIIREILELLDREGDCASVVNKHPKEAEREYTANRYETLAKVTLLEHSLLVAELMVSKQEYNVLIPRCIIEALGHDLGKLAGVYKFHYKKSDHPGLSKELLMNMRYFSQYRFKEDALKDIVGHHPFQQYKNMAPMAKLLIECDNEARSIECQITCT